MISNTHKFLFIAIPKTATSSIHQAFHDYSDCEMIYVTYDTALGTIEGVKLHNFEYDIGKHASLSQYKNKIEPNIYKKLFKFTCIRNPWEWAFSFYKYERLVKGRDLSKCDFKKYVKQLPAMSSYIKLRPGRIKWLWRFYHKAPNIAKILTGNNVDDDMNYIMRTESLQKDVEKVCEMIGIPPVQVPRLLEVPKREDYKDFYDDETRKWILANNYDIINYANYKFE